MKKIAATTKPAFTPITIRSSEQLAFAIRRIRKLNGLSQTELANKTGLTQATISRVESDSKKVEIGTMFLIFAALSSDLIISPRKKIEGKASLEGLF